MFPWKTVITLNRNSKRPQYLQITDQVVREISAGRLHRSQRIPGSRKMAELLQLNRKTVIQAYEELLAQGWLTAKASSGTYISDDLPIPKNNALQSINQVLSEVEQPVRNKFEFIPPTVKLPAHSIAVDGGSPDHRLAPMDWIYRESRSLINSTYGKHLLTYSDIKGELKLRNTLAQYLSETRGMNLATDNILITRGSQMGIFLAIQSLSKPGDHVVVGSSSYDAADWAFEYHGCTINRIEVDHDGLNIDALHQLCKTTPIKIVYITPHHHFPTTVTLANTRRMQLMELAIVYNFIIIEDDYDYDFHYKSSPILPLASLDHGGRVIYVGSFSKVFAPNIRVGYVAAAAWQVDHMSRIRRIVDRQGDQVMERVMAEAITSGELTRHLKKSLRVYKQRRDHLAKLLSVQLSHYVEYDLPEGGMAIWVRFKNLLLSELKPSLVRVGLVLDIDKFLVRRFNGFRLGFASIDEKEQEKIIELLGKAITQSAS